MNTDSSLETCPFATPPPPQHFIIYLKFSFTSMNKRRRVIKTKENSLKGRNFHGKKISRISRFLLKSAKLNSRENFQNLPSAKLNSARNFSKSAIHEIKFLRNFQNRVSVFFFSLFFQHNIKIK